MNDVRPIQDGLSLVDEMVHGTEAHRLGAGEGAPGELLDKASSLARFEAVDGAGLAGRHVPSREARLNVPDSGCTVEVRR